MPENNRTVQPDGKQLRKENEAESCREVNQKTKSVSKILKSSTIKNVKNPPEDSAIQKLPWTGS